MASAVELIDLLRRALDDPARRAELAKQFQAQVWDTKDMDADPETVRVLRDLAYDLDFFEPDEEARNEDSALYGEVRLEAEIRSAVEALHSLSGSKV